MSTSKGQGITKLILVIVITLCQGMKDLQTQTVNLSGIQEQEHQLLSKIMPKSQNIRRPKEDVSNARNAKTKGHIFRKFVKQLLSDKFAKANKKMNGFIEIELEKTKHQGVTTKEIPIVVNGQRYSRFIRLC